MKKAMVLMYHSIGSPSGKAALKSLNVTPHMFRFQMWYLKTAGFRVVSLGGILEFVRGDRSDDKLVALTFDDGFQDFYQNAYPVLKEHGYPSTVFLVSDFIGRENLWEKPDCRKRLLDWDMISEMKDGGVTFGSHTRTHPFLSGLSEDRLRSEVSDSKVALEQRLGAGIEFFCYPYGGYDDVVRDAVRKTGYLGAVTTKRGPVYRGDNPFEMRRSFIRRNTHPLLFMYKLHSGYEDRLRVKG